MACDSLGSQAVADQHRSHGSQEASPVGGWQPWPFSVPGQGDLFPASEYQIVFPLRGLMERPIGPVCQGLSFPRT